MSVFRPRPSLTTGSHRIRSLSVIGGFLDGLTFEFDNGLNCLIGVRGTGKTTVLEFAHYALDLLPSRDCDASERHRIESLIQRNLASGRIEVGIETKDGLNKST
jgi:DNA repair exonuclease SbcCD ATPase subunit